MGSPYPAVTSVGSQAMTEIDIVSAIFGVQCSNQIGLCVNADCLGCGLMPSGRFLHNDMPLGLNEQNITILGANVACADVFNGIRQFGDCQEEGNEEMFCSVLDKCWGVAGL